MADTIFDLILQHTDGEITKEIDEWVTNVALSDSRYIFIDKTEAGERLGYCTHCRSMVPYEKEEMKHNAKTFCPICGSRCTVKHAFRGHKYLEDKACILYFEKSKLDPTIMIARGYTVWRNYRDGYRDIQNQYWAEAVYVFDDSPKMYKRYYWGGRWEERASIFQFNINGLANIDSCLHKESLEQAVVGTKYQYCPYDYYYPRVPILKILEKYHKSPIIEQVTKAGHEYWRVVQDALDGYNTYGTLNWRAKNIYSFFKLSKAELKEIHRYGECISIDFLYWWKICKNKKAGLNPTEVRLLAKIVGHNDHAMEEILKHTTLRKAAKYMIKQGGYSVPVIWKDYIHDCEKLGYDLTDESILFPRCVDEAHHRTIKLVKYKNDKEMSQRIAERVRELSKLYLKQGNLFVRAAKDMNEIINEGKVLCHCVGGYAKRHASGETTILFIRKTEDPDKPYYTMEVQNGEVVQVHGYKNDRENPVPLEVKAFVELFKQEKLHKRKRKQKIPA